MALRPTVDKDECISSGRCVADFPSAFAFDDEELAEVLPGASELDDEQVIRAVRTCPGEAIAALDADGAEVEVR